MRRVQSGRILRPQKQKYELQDIQLLNEANRKLHQLQVMEALSLFKEYIERMKAKHGLDSPQFDLKAILMIVCQFALDLQTQTGKHDLPITMLLWAEDQSNNTCIKKDVMKLLADAYRKAGQTDPQVSQSQVQLNQKFKIVKPMMKNKSETGLKTFYFRGNNNNNNNNNTNNNLLLFNLNNSSQKEIDKQKQQKQFVIKKLNQPQQKEIDWSSSDEENKQAPPQFENIEPIIENNQRQLRLQFLYQQIPYKLEWRTIVSQKMEEEKCQINLIPVKAIIKIQSAFRRKIQMRRYKKLLREAYIKKRQENYDECIIAIQRWVRFILRTSRFRNAAYALLKIKRLSRYPLREFLAATKIQKFIKKFQQKKQNAKSSIWRRKTFEHQFDFVQQAIFNRTFYLTVKNDNKSIIFTIQPQFKKKCDRKLLNKMVIEILIEQFNYTLARLPEYIDSLESEIEPNMQVLQAIKLLHKSAQKFISPIPNSFKLSLPLNHFYRNLHNIPYEDLIYFDDFNILQIHGFHDFQYTDMFVMEKQNTQNKLQNIKQLPGQERIISIIQTIFKTKRAVQLMKQKLHRRRDIYKSFYVGNKILYAQVFITTEKTIYARWITQRRWQKTNIMGISNLVSKQIGYPCRENFFEIYQIKDDNKLVYTEEAQFWATKEVELTVKRKKLNFYQISIFAQRIQRAARRYLAEKELIIHRGIAKHQKEMSKSLVRKVVLSGDPVRAYFMNFQLITDSGNKQSISIDVKALEHIYSNEYVHPYTQPLFYEIEISELTKIAQKMVELGQVTNVKGQTRFDVCNLMEVQGQLMDEQDEESQQKKESTLGARKILNHYMRKKWEQKLLIDIPVQKVEKQKKQKQQKKQQKVDNIFEYITIFFRYKEYRKQQIQHLIDEKQVIPYDQESISNFVRQFKPVSNYCYGQQEEGKYNVNFLEEMKKESENKIQREKQLQEKQEQEDKQKKIDELERQRLLRESLCFIFHDYCVISGQRLSIRIVYHKTLKQVIIKSISEDGQQNEINVNINQILPIEFKIEFLKIAIDMLVIKQLIVKDEELFFIQDSHQQEMLQLEYVQWEQCKNKQIDYSNLVGNVYGLEQVFGKLNKSKTTFENLVICGKQVFHIITIHMKDHQQEYVMNLSDCQLILTIYLDENPNDFKIMIIPIQEFKCVYLMNTVLHKPPNNISKLLLPTIYALNKLIEIDENNECNFLKIKPYLSLIFQEQFAIKLQQRLKISQQEIHYRILRKRDINSIYLQTRYINSDCRYVKISFFLMDYLIKIVFQKLNDIDQRGQIINSKEKQIYFIDLLKQNFKQDQFRLNPDKWVDIQQVRLPEYYQKMYKPLVDYIMESFKIEYPFRINFNKDLQAWKQVEKKRKLQSETVFFNMIEAVIKLQVHYKTFKQQERYLLRKLNYQNNHSKSRQLGKLCYRTYKQFDNIMYLVSIYIQNGIEDQITVNLIDTTDKYNKNKQYRGIYIKDPTTMLNLGQGVFYQFLLNLLYLEDGLLKFKSEEFEQLTQQTTENQLTLQIEEPGKIELINHIQKHYDNKIADTIYNVVHSGQSQIQFNQNSNNTVQVSVNLSDLKKLYPSLHTQDQSVMKMVSDQIIDGIQVSRQGIVQVDQQRINPSFIKIQQSKTIDVQEPNGKRPQSKIITLSKKTSYYLKEKYLLVVNMVERKVAKIIEEDKDSVYSHYEELFQLVATSLTVQNKEPMEWELSIFQAEQLTHQKSQKPIAKELSRRTLIINEKFVFLAIEKKDIERHHYNNVILFLEKGIRPIQNKFRNRRRQLNFQKYRETLKMWRDSQGKLYDNCVFTLESLKSDRQFIVLAGEDKGKHLMIIAWDLAEFQKYELELPKIRFQSIFAVNKQESIKLLPSFTEFVEDKLQFNLNNLSAIHKVVSEQYQGMKQQIYQQ